MTALPSRKAPARTSAVRQPSKAGDLVIVGKDVLELLSSAMYLDPLSIYREYVQNAADAIDEARANGLLGQDQPGRVEIEIDAGARTVRVRDNGAGIPCDEAAARLLSIGGSLKRGTAARGFRGVGRLAGLAYCKQLIFRTRAAGDGDVVELRWDCMRLKAALRQVGVDDDLPGVIDQIVSFERVPAASDCPPHFFEVELRDLVRHHRRDALINEDMIAEYLAEVAPVPFDATFALGEKLKGHVAPHVRMGELEIHVGGLEPVRRPHRDVFPASELATGAFSEPEILTFYGRDGQISAVGWIAHHAYLGALPSRSKIKGLRLRCGNVQIGGGEVLQDVFAEPRFNSWTVGEIHVLDPRIVPNARRDHFEQNVHYADLTAQLEPLARSLAKRCRMASLERNAVKAVVRSLSPLASPAVTSTVGLPVIDSMKTCLASMTAFARRFAPPAERVQLLQDLNSAHASLVSSAALTPQERGSQLITSLLNSGELSAEDVVSITSGWKSAQPPRERS